MFCFCNFILFIYIIIIIIMFSSVDSCYALSLAMNFWALGGRLTHNSARKRTHRAHITSSNPLRHALLAIRQVLVAVLESSIMHCLPADHFLRRTRLASSKPLMSHAKPCSQSVSCYKNWAHSHWVLLTSILL